jgi:hypothetical protein
MGPRHGEGLGARCRLGDHCKIVLEREQRGRRAPDQMLVIRATEKDAPVRAPPGRDRE